MYLKIAIASGVLTVTILGIVYSLLQIRQCRPRPLPVGDVRYIANAAGGLLPVLAEALRDTFTSAVILTSYGMTEW